MHVPPLFGDNSRMADMPEDNSVTEDGSGEYRDKPYNFQALPFNIEQHLEFIDISEDGHLLLGSSNLVTRHWCGSIWVFKDCAVEPTKLESICSHGCDSCVSCGQFLESWDKVIIGEDSGKLAILTISSDDSTSNFLPNLSATHHDGSISSLCIVDSSTKTVSAGCDQRINVWDNSSLELQQKYCPAHSMDITQVISSYNKEDQSFLSSSLDGLALLWDPRQSKPASALFELNFGITSLSWVNEYTLAAGSDVGNVHLKDIRNKKEIHYFNFHQQPVHHVSSFKGMVAACGNSNIVKIWDSSTQELLYTGSQHTALVRWVSWNPTNNLLYSCGFDRRIFPHSISVSSEPTPS